MTVPSGHLKITIRVESEMDAIQVESTTQTFPTDIAVEMGRELVVADTTLIIDALEKRYKGG